LTGVRVGQTAEIKIDAFPDKPLTARIDSVSPASGAEFALLPPDNATGNFNKIVQRVPVKLVFDNPGELAGLLRPGMSVEVSVDTRTAAAQ
ncbi:MAG TPA: HlyD family secretion protein, partial [Solimonas sp.]